VSDRKLTWVKNSAIVHEEDVWNKATVFCRSATIAYTGPARIQDQRTDQWIADAIAPCTNIDEALERLRAGATDHLSRGHWNPRGLAIVAAGWRREHGQTVPFRAAISNYLEPGGQTGPLRDSFAVLMSNQLAPGLGIYVAGRDMPRTNTLRMGRSIKRGYERRISMKTVARTMIEVARELHDPYVGESFNSVVVPLPSNESARDVFEAMMEGPKPNIPTSYYFPAAGAYPEYVIPNFACAGFQMTDIIVHPRALTPEEIAERYRAGRPLPPTLT
jgi:hypothetical protein